MYPIAKWSVILAAAGIVTTAGSSCSRGAPSVSPDAYYTFDNATDTTVPDLATGGAHPLTLKGGATIAPTAKVGSGALSVADTADAESAMPVVDTTKSFTVSAWVNLKKIGGFQTFVSQDGSSVSGFYLQLRAGGSFAFTRIAADKPGDGYIAASTVQVQPNTWYNLTGVYDDSNKTEALYVNGVLQQVTPCPQTWNASGPFAVGRAKFDGHLVDYANALIDDVRVYSGVHADAADMARLAHETGADRTTLAIHAGQHGPKVNPDMYGLMIEDISHSIDGGLYAELVRNRSLKDSNGNPDFWTAQDGATIAVDTQNPVPNTALTNALRVQLAGGTGWSGATNAGYWGVPSLPRSRYTVSLYAKGAPGYTGPLRIVLQRSSDKTALASATIPHVSSNWQKYSTTFTTGAVAKSADNVLAVLGQGAGTVWVTQVSCFPPTYKNRANGTRQDLMQLLDGMKPAFLRMPGGNYLEGNTLPDRFNWKETIGDIAARPGHQDPWGYRSTDGFGLLEYLDWCEDLKMKPLLAVFAGFTLNGTHVTPGADLAPYVQDALDEIEYVTGSTATKWGAVRAANGHPAPFPLEYVEIGNEDFFDQSGSYNGRFAQFFDAIRAAYPKLKLIATRSDVTGRTPDVIDDHYYRAAADFESDFRHYDSYDRTRPAVFVGEYASQEGKPTPNLAGALGDAAFMIGMERNADVVRLAAYAPLLVNINPGASQWPTNLIGFDAVNSYASPAYYVQRLFSLYHGMEVVPSENTGLRSLITVVSRAANGDLIVKAVNASPEPIKTSVTIDGGAARASTGSAIVLQGASLDATNAIDSPNAVVPVTHAVSGLGSAFTYTFPAHSVTVLRIPKR